VTTARSLNRVAVQPWVGSWRHRNGFWVVAFAFLTVMALGTVPSPLYGLYRVRDHFSLFTVTVAFAVYAIGVIVALLLGGHLSDLYGRRRLLLPSIAIAIASAVAFLLWKSLAGLLAGRLISGIAIGIVASTATAYLAELHAVGQPQASAQKAQLTASAVNIGGLAVGALVAGLLAQWAAHPLTVPYLVFGAALVLAAIGAAFVPETHEAATPRPRYRPQHLSIPHAEMGRFFAAALSSFWAFAANGLFAGLAGVFLAVTLHHPSRALAGGVVAVMFGAAVAAQFLTVGWPVTRELGAGMASMVIGIALAVVAVWLHTPSLALFIAGGALIGAGSGAIFKGAVGTVMTIAPPGRVAESLTGVFLCAYVGISLPVVGAGIALTRDVSPKVTLLGFAIAVTTGIAASALKLLGRPTTTAPAGPPAPQTPTTEGRHMSDNPNEITIDNSVLVLVDHQPWVAFSVKSIDAGLLVNNLAGLAASAKALDVPTILTTVGAEGGVLRDPLLNGLAEVRPEVTPIDRVSTNAWEDIRGAVEATGRRTLLIAGLWSEVCLAQTAVSAIAEGYRVFFVSDCSGGLSDEAHQDAKARLVQAGATPINWVAVVCEWTPDYTSEERNRAIPAVMKYGSMAGISVEYLVAQTDLVPQAG